MTEQREIDHYNLDLIITLGCRMHWAIDPLLQYVKDYDLERRRCVVKEWEKACCKPCRDLVESEIMCNFVPKSRERAFALLPCKMKDMGEELLVDLGNIEDLSKSIIKVIGVGGGGCNAVRNMFDENITGVSLAVCNTDSKSLAPSPVPVKIMLGEGLGAGGKPEVGRSEAEKNIADIEQLLSDGTKMVFVTASMGGGTGTGSAPVVAGVAKRMGMLTCQGNWWYKNIK